MIYLTSAIHFALFFALKFQITTFAFVNVVLKIIDPFNPLIMAILIFVLHAGLQQQLEKRAVATQLGWLTLFVLLSGALNLLVVNPFLFDLPIVWAEWWRPVLNGALPMLTGGAVLVLTTRYRARTVGRVR